MKTRLADDATPSPDVRPAVGVFPQRGVLPVERAVDVGRLKAHVPQLALAQPRQPSSRLPPAVPALHRREHPYKTAAEAVCSGAFVCEFLESAYLDDPKQIAALIREAQARILVRR